MSIDINSVGKNDEILWTSVEEWEELPEDAAGALSGQPHTQEEEGVRQPCLTGHPDSLDSVDLLSESGFRKIENPQKREKLPEQFFLWNL